MMRPIKLVLSLFALNPEDAVSAMSGVNTSACRSNSTHIVWKTVSRPSRIHGDPERRATHERRIESSSTDKDHAGATTAYHCSVQTRKDAEASCMLFLRNNVMPFDEQFRETMGFPLGDDDNPNADGLATGLVEPTISLALDAKVLYKWTDDLPPEIFMEYVLNYANLNEARTNWRPLLVDALKFNESELYRSSLRTTAPATATGTVATWESTLNVTSVTTWVNTNLWNRLGREGAPIYFKSSQTPLVFDPMSVVAFGYASCTGTSILFCNALRAVGVPARVVGTPAWYGNRTQGNHNWVEVYVPDAGSGGAGEWKFLEPSPALPSVDTLDGDPCGRWFCDPGRYPSSRVYAARLWSGEGESPPAVHFPLAWEWDCHGVPAEERTDYYARVCGSCSE